MNPVIIIPTYWSSPEYRAPEDLFGSYDHMTPIDREGELSRCLRSLCDIRGICRVILLVVAEELPAGKATERVHSIADQFPTLDIVVVGPEEMGAAHARLDDMGLSEYKEAVTTTGYGSVRNTGLLVAAILGHTEVVFIDDDEIVEDKDFLIKSLYGLGKLTKRNIPILAKTGYFLDRRGSWTSQNKDPWYNAAFKQTEAFDKWITKAMSGPRLVPSNTACGGCMSIHAEAFKRVAFDPWITRGEDLDYMINMRMYGLDVWFDNTWSIRHIPPQTVSDAVRFRQNIFRWIYEHRKLEYLRSQIDLIQIRPHDLDPYPGPFVDSSITSRLYVTSLLRSIALPERGGYFHAAQCARKEAEDYAQQHCERYFRFQAVWPSLIAALSDDPILATAFTNGRERRHSGFTEQFSKVASEDIWEQETSSPQKKSSRRSAPEPDVSASDIADKWTRSNVSDKTAVRRSRKRQ